MGIFVDHMVCGMSGEHKLAINKPIESCSDICDSGDDYGFSRSCCDYDSFYFKDDVPATSSETKTKPLASAFRYIPAKELFAESKCAESRCLHLVEEPDILPSVERHILLETYLI